MKTGIVEFILSNVGSKSEKMQPFLKESDGTLTEIFKESDNPFVNESLKEYEGKTVTVTGEENEYGLYIIDTIEVVGDAPKETETTEKADVEVIEEKTEPSEKEKATVETVEEKSETVAEDVEKAEAAKTVTVSETETEKPLRGFKKLFAVFHKK